jgi:hypothetical protein
MNEIFLGIAAAGVAILLLVLVYGAIEGTRYVVDQNGIMVPEPSDIEQLLAPLWRRQMSGLRGGRDRALIEMRWAGLEKYSPELWTLLPLVLGPAGLAGGFGVGTILHLGLPLLPIFAIGLGVVGYSWPNSHKGGKVRARNDLIREEVPRFIGTYSRLYMIQRDPGRAFESMAERVLRFRNADAPIKDPKAARLLRRRSRLRGRGGYDSPIWDGVMALAQAQRNGKPIVDREMAAQGKSDPLTNFALFCNDRDITRFVTLVRESWVLDRPLNPETIDVLARNVQEGRVQEVRQSFARMQAEATTFMVTFNFPVLMMVVALPIIATIVMGN